MNAWIVVAVVGGVTILFKGAGPVFLGRRALPGRVQSVVDLLAPVMLVALVVTQAVGAGAGISLDARIPGVAAGALAVWRRLPIVVAMAIAATVTAVVRLV
jgi:branched chain amino acid efflux pump